MIIEPFIIRPIAAKYGVSEQYVRAVNNGTRNASKKKGANIKLELERIASLFEDWETNFDYGGSIRIVMPNEVQVYINGFVATAYRIVANQQPLILEEHTFDSNFTISAFKRWLNSIRISY